MLVWYILICNELVVPSNVVLHYHAHIIYNHRTEKAPSCFSCVLSRLTGGWDHTMHHNTTYNNINHINYKHLEYIVCVLYASCFCTMSGITRFEPASKKHKPNYNNNHNENNTQHNHLYNKLNKTYSTVPPSIAIDSTCALTRTLSDITDIHANIEYNVDFESHLQTGIKPKQFQINKELSKLQTTEPITTDVPPSTDYLPYEFPLPPLDYSIVLRLKFVSSGTFDWINNISNIDKHRLPYIQSSEFNKQKSMNQSQQYCNELIQCISIYQYPAESHTARDSFINEYMRANNKHITDRNVNDIQVQQRMALRWELFNESHVSLHSLYTYNYINHYYVILNNPCTTILFTKRYIGDTDNVELIAIITKSTKQFCDQLVSHCITYESVQWHDSSNINSLAIVISNNDCVDNIDALCGVIQDIDRRNDDVPILLSHHEFDHSVRKKATYRTNQIKPSINNKNDTIKYSLEITGLLLPHNVTKLYHLMQRTQLSNYSVYINHESDYKDIQKLNLIDSIRDINSNNCNLIHRVCSNDTPITTDYRLISVYNNSIIRAAIMTYIDTMKTVITLPIKHIQCNTKQDRTAAYKIGF